MSVVVTSRFERRPWGGYDDPRLPTGLYYDQRSCTGDGSGGDLSISFQFGRSAEVRDSSLYSLESVYAYLDDNAAVTARMVVTGFDQFRNNAVPVVRYPLRIDGTYAGYSMLGRDSLDWLPLFLGQQQQPTGALAMSSVRFDAPNTLNRVWTVGMGGYIWGPDAVSAPNGGLMRPGGGFYRA